MYRVSHPTIVEPELVGSEFEPRRPVLRRFEMN